MTDEKIPRNFVIYNGFLSPNYVTFSAITKTTQIVLEKGLIISKLVFDECRNQRCD